MRILYLTADSQFSEGPVDAEQRAAMKEYGRLDLWPELEQVTDVLFDARAEGRVSLEVVPETSRQDVTRYLAEHPLEVLHFSGHGDRVSSSDDADPEHHLILMDANHEGLFGEYTPNEWLAGQLRDRELRLIILNCCWSAGVAEKLKGCADCIIGTRFEIREDIAARFSALLYRELSQGTPLGAIEALISEHVAKDQYEFIYRTDAARQLTLAPIPPEERKQTPPREVLSKGEELDHLYAAHRLSLQTDYLKVAFAGVVAFVGWVMFSGAFGLLGELNCTDQPLCPATPLDYLRVLVSKAEWLRWEPAAIMAAACANPLGRIAAYLSAELGFKATRSALSSLSLRPPAAIERYLASGRINAMINWLRGASE